MSRQKATTAAGVRQEQRRLQGAWLARCIDLKSAGLEKEEASATRRRRRDRNLGRLREIHWTPAAGKPVFYGLQHSRCSRLGVGDAKYWRLLTGGMASQGKEPMALSTFRSRSSTMCELTNVTSLAGDACIFVPLYPGGAHPGSLIGTTQQLAPPSF